MNDSKLESNIMSDGPPAATANHLIWARDSDNSNAIEHPAYLLDDRTSDGDSVWIKWAANGTIVQMPKSRIGLGLAPRRRRRANNVATSTEQVPTNDTKIKKEPGYDDDTDDEGSPKSAIIPSPVSSAAMVNSIEQQASATATSSSAVKVKEEAYDYDADEGTTAIDSRVGRGAKSFVSESTDETAATSASSSMLTEKRNSTIKSAKQKDKPRKWIAAVFEDRLTQLSSNYMVWNIKPSSFRSNEIIPLDFVQFDNETNRYQVSKEEMKEEIVEDDIILQAMVVFSLYRMEKGWGKGRSYKAFSIWGGDPAEDEDDSFPLQNLWEEEIQQKIAQKKLGPTTLKHFDNFDVFPKFYLPESRRNRWKRRSDSHVGQVNILAEQAAIQVALHLHEKSRDYATLASLIISTALSGDGETMNEITMFLLNAALSESVCFPKTALDNISTGKGGSRSHGSTLIPKNFEARQEIVRVEGCTKSSQDMPETKNPGSKQQTEEDSTATLNKKRKSDVKMKPNKRRQGPRSTKQKEGPRQKIADEIFRLSDLCYSKVWGLGLSSFSQSSFSEPSVMDFIKFDGKSGSWMDFIEFDGKSGRYKVKGGPNKRYKMKHGSSVTEDDIILQAMVVFAIYRMEKGWGKSRANKALSIWGGDPANDKDDEFPLTNLWADEIQVQVAAKVIGPTTLNHVDNFDVFPSFYQPENPLANTKWARRSNSYIGQLHVLAEQAAVQLALYLHESVSHDYADLANSIISVAWFEDTEILKSIIIILVDSAREETDCLASTALDNWDEWRYGMERHISTCPAV